MWWIIFIVILIVIVASNSNSSNKTTYHRTNNYRDKKDRFKSSFQPVEISEIPENDDRLTSLKQYIGAGQEISIGYRNSSGFITKRRIKPLKITAWKGDYYLRAYCTLRGEDRTFKISRIFSINNEIKVEKVPQVQVKSQKVFLVESDERVLEICKSFCRRNKVSYATAKDGITALEKIKDERFDFIFIDQEIPYVKGIDVLKNIKKKNLSDAPVVIISSKGNEKIQKESEKLGAEDYFVYEEINQEELISAIEHYLS